MKVNVFEGARRLVLLLQGAWVIGCIAMFLTDKPDLLLRYESPWPSTAFVETQTSCALPDATKSLIYDLGDGKTASIDLCFKAQRYPKGTLLIPYDIEGSGNTPGSDEVLAYMGVRAAEFGLSDEARQSALQEWNQLRWNQFGVLSAVSIAGGILLSISSSIMGWIVRGFLGIPSAKDGRGASTGQRRAERLNPVFPEDNSPANISPANFS